MTQLVKKDITIDTDIIQLSHVKDINPLDQMALQLNFSRKEFRNLLQELPCTPRMRLCFSTRTKFLRNV